MEHVSAVHWLVVVAGTLASLGGGYLLARNAPRISVPGLLGEGLGLLAVAFLFMQGVTVFPALLPVLIGSAGTVAGLLGRARP